MSAIIGGVLIAISSSLMLLYLGRMTGISSIFSQVLNFSNPWRISFIGGLVFGGFAMKIFFPSFFSYEFTGSFIEIIIAGLLVGFGTNMANGCTSGHGVCGIPRLSLRSIMATITFMTAGVITVYVKGFFL